MPTKKDEASVLEFRALDEGHVRFAVLGQSPIILNRMSEKSQLELAAPGGRKTAASKASTVKHSPIAEFWRAPYVLRDKDAPTLLAQVSTAFKKALASAALDIPGAQKAQIGRLSYVSGEYVPLFGIPELFMAVTRSADMNRTPDIRTRAIIRDWACYIEINYAVPLLNKQSIANLLITAGRTQGVGDWRVQKGSGSFGRFTLVAEDHPDFLEIVANGGRTAQIAAMEESRAYDEDTEELLAAMIEAVRQQGKEFDTPVRRWEVTESAAADRVNGHREMARV